MIYLPEKVYRQLETKIVPLVRALHEIDIPTRESCQGHLGKPGRDPFPYVLVDGTSSIFYPNQFIQLLGVVKAWNQFRERKWQWLLAEHVENGVVFYQIFRLGPWEANINHSSVTLSRLRNNALSLAEFIIHYPS